MPVNAVRTRTTVAPRRITAPTFTVPAVLRRENLRLTPWGVVAIMSVLVLGSLWLRVRSLDFHYWIDEGLSVGISSHPLRDIPSLLRQDGSPPLYYLLLHVWMGVFGKREVATHVLSLLFVLATIPAAYWAGTSLFDRRAGVISAVLAAGVPYLTVYAQETRMYALLALLALIVAGSFVHAFVRRHRRYLLLFSASLAAALYTHNWALFLGVTSAVAFLLCVRVAEPEQRRLLWRDGLVAFGGVIVLYAPWLPTLLYQARHTGAPWALPPVVWSLSQGLYSLVGGRGAAMLLLLAGGSGLVALKGVDDRPRRLRLAVACLVVLGIGTLLTAWVYAKVTPSWAIRYLAVIVGPLILLFGLGLARAGRLGLVALALAVCFWVLDPIAHSLNSKSNVAAVAAKFRRDLGPGSLVLSTQPEQVPTIAYYLPRVSHYATPMGPVADPRVFDWVDALRRLRRSSVRSTLLPLVNSLAPGDHLLLVLPMQFQTTPLWLKLIYRYSEQWSAALNHDHLLRRVAVTSSGSSPSGMPVRAVLYIRR